MKKITQRFIIALSVLVTSLSIIPNISFADDDCDTFWWTCYSTEIEVINNNGEKNSDLLDTIKNAINWILWLLATIALVICMYAWFKVLTSGGDSKWYDAWMKILKNAALWLALILLAWMIVSLVFWFVDTLTPASKS